MVEQKFLEHVAGGTIEQLEARMADESLLPFEKDYLFAHKTLERLKILGNAEAVAALDLLVPRRNPDGTRQIADRRINQKLEALIASRIYSREISLLGQDGAWGGLPAVVRGAIQRSGNIGLFLEATNKCTVMCDFCGLSEKGEITTKVDFWSVIEMIRGYYHDSLQLGIYESQLPVDGLFWDTDPFDARWYNPSRGEDLDYGDVLEKHAEICGLKRAMFTSTAVPVGEELRVLRALLWFLQAKSEGKIHRWTEFRFSLTDTNEYRLKQILTIAEAFHRNLEQLFGVVVTSNKKDHSFLAGARTGKFEKATFADVVGVNCRDGLIFSTKGPECVTMVGTSTERPSGEVRWPARSVLPDERIRYEIPTNYYRDDITNDPNLENYYPNVVVQMVTLEPDHDPVFEWKTIKEDPHRCFLRAAAITYYHLAKSGKYQWDPKSLSQIQKETFRRRIGRDLEVVRRHLLDLSQKGKTNPMMEVLFTYVDNALKS